MIRAAPIAARWRVELTGRELRLVVPAVWAGLNPFAPLRRVTVPISEVRAVEIREEVSRFAGIVSLARALSVATTNGDRFVLGQATGQEVSALPIDEMAQAIADAAGRPVTDRGTINAPSFLQTTLFGGRRRGTVPMQRPFSRRPRLRGYAAGRR